MHFVAVGRDISVYGYPNPVSTSISHEPKTSVTSVSSVRDLLPCLDGYAYSSSSSLLESISLIDFRLRRRSQLFQVFRRLSFTEMYSSFRSFCFGI